MADKNDAKPFERSADDDVLWQSVTVDVAPLRTSKNQHYKHQD